VLAVSAHLNSTLAASHPRFLRTEDMRLAALVGNLATLAASHPRFFRAEFMRVAALV
jgi:hypothetical protein